MYGITLNHSYTLLCLERESNQNLTSPIWLVRLASLSWKFPVSTY